MRWVMDMGSARTKAPNSTGTAAPSLRCRRIWNRLAFFAQSLLAATMTTRLPSCPSWEVISSTSPSTEDHVSVGIVLSNILA